MTDPNTEPCFEEFGIWHVEAGGFLPGLYSNDLVAVEVAKQLHAENPGQHYECRLYSRVSLASVMREAARAAGSVRSERKAISSRENGKLGGRPRKTEVTSGNE